MAFQFNKGENILELHLHLADTHVPFEIHQSILFSSLFGWYICVVLSLNFAVTPKIIPIEKILELFNLQLGHFQN